MRRGIAREKETRKKMFVSFFFLNVMAMLNFISYDNFEFPLKLLLILKKLLWIIEEKVTNIRKESQQIDSYLNEKLLHAMSSRNINLVKHTYFFPISLLQDLTFHFSVLVISKTRTLIKNILFVFVLFIFYILGFICVHIL